MQYTNEANKDSSRYDMEWLDFMIFRLKDLIEVAFNETAKENYRVHLRFYEAEREKLLEKQQHTQ